GRLAPDYLSSLRYELAVLGGWLTGQMPGDGLVILLGDHQPPAVVGGQPQPPWTVPIHVLSRDPDLVAPFLAEGSTSPASSQPRCHPTRAWRIFSAGSSPLSIDPAELQSLRWSGRTSSSSAAARRTRSASLDSRWSPSLTRATTTSRLARCSARRRLVCQGTASSSKLCRSRTGQRSGISARITRCRRPSSNRPSGKV